MAAVADVSDETVVSRVGGALGDVMVAKANGGWGVYQPGGPAVIEVVGGVIAFNGMEVTEVTEVTEVPELPAAPDAQDVADALVVIGLVTQAA